MANRTKQTDKSVERFLAALNEGWSVTRACAAANIGRATAYEWREADDDFALAWDRALEAGTDKLEDEAYRRAVEGERRMVVREGGPVMVSRDGYDDEGLPRGPLVPLFETKRSDTLTIVLLKARRPEKYRERFEHSGAVDLGVDKLLEAIDGRTRGLPGRG